MQKLAEVCVRRPVFASMLIAAIVVIGGARSPSSASIAIRASRRRSSP